MFRQVLAPIAAIALVTAPVTAHAAPGLGSAGSQEETGPHSGDSGLGEGTNLTDPASTAAPQESDAPAQAPTDASDGSVPVAAAQTAEVSIDAAADAVTVLGVTWDSSGTVPTTVEYRVLDEDGSAGAWVEIEALAGEGPDPGTAEAGGARTGTEPVIVAESADIEVRIDRGDADVQTTTTSVTAADEDLAAQADSGAGAAAPTPSAPTTAASRANAANAPLSYTTRAQWGADESLKKCEPDTTSANRAMVVHHTAGATSYTKAQVPGILRGILSYHTQSLGWCDVGYNMLVDRYGTVYEGRAGGPTKAIVGAHASGFNTGTFGVSVMGTYSAAAPAAAVDALGRVGSWQADLWNYDPTANVTLTSGGGTSKHTEGKKVSLPRVFGHRDTSATECPGAGLYGQLSQVRSKAKAGRTGTGFPVPGEIGKFYEKNTSKTGKPIIAQRCGMTDDGCFQRFEKGSVHWSKASGAHFTKANSGVQNAWKRYSYERGRLGYPTGEEFALKDAAGAVAQHFQGGTVVWSSATAGRPLVGAVGRKWKALGWERSQLRLPRTDEKCTLTRGGCYQQFQGGSIHWTAKTGAHETRGAIQRAWGTQKWENGRLGYPTTDEFKSGSTIRQNFEGGYITWSSTDGATIRYS